MDESVVIVFRNMKDEDLAMIYSTWRNSSYYSAVSRPEMPTNEAFRIKTIEIKNIMTNCEAKVACLKDSPDTIIGYSIWDDKHLYWVYVKPEYRRQGIAKRLVPKDIETIPEELTALGERIAEKKPFKKEKKHGRNSNTTVQESQNDYVH